MAMDVSEREEMEAQLRNAQRLESLGVLAGGVAHDFNSSLMVILGNTALLRSLKGLPAKAHEYIELVEEASFRAKDFINHLLAYARTGRHRPHATDLNTVVQSVLTLVRSSIGRHHRLERKLAKQPPMILADPGQLEQVILNLCLNADQALSGEGIIEISTGVTTLTTKRAARCIPHGSPAGRYVQLVVRDNGSGMDRATTARIFDPFFTTKTGGHGLGLAAVLGILRQHNACVLVDSAVGKGTKMHVFFPLHKRDYRATSEAPLRKQGA
jgi:signal transduction histidine kinase